MNYWYLVASLPALAEHAPPPLSPAQFRMLCGEHLVPADLAELDAVLAGGGASAFARAWQQRRGAIASGCAALRAVRLGLDPAPYRSEGVPDLWLAAAVHDAMQQGDPRARERQLDALGWRLLGELGEPAPFGLPAVLAYGLRLQLAARQAARTEAKGRERLAQHLGALLAEFDRLAGGAR